MTNKKLRALTLALLFAITFPLFTAGLACAHTPAWELQTWAYIEVNPNPVGVGQNLFISMWVDKPMPEALVSNDIRRHNYELTITKPDNTTEKKVFDYVSDTTGVQSISYIPDKVGTYTFVFHYPQQTYTWSATTAQKIEWIKASLINSTNYLKF
jgi:hypothetical protein